MGPGLPLSGYQQAGRAILAILIITLGKPAKGAISLEPDDQCAAVGQSSQFTCETTVTTGQFLWQRERPSTPGKLDRVASNYIGAAAGYSVTYDEAGSPVRSTLTVLGVNPTMNGDKYLCSRGTESRRATLTVSECSWCDNVETAGISQYVSVNSHPVPATCKLKAGRFDIKLDLSSSPQEFSVSVTMTLDGREISGASKTVTYDCATAYSPLTISGITLDGGQLTMKVTINHPSLSSTEFYPIRECTVTGKTSDNVAPIIGAVVGVIVVLVVLIIGIFAFLVWQKRRARGKNEEIHGEGASKGRGNIRGKFKIFRTARKGKTTAEAEAKIYERTNPTYVNEHMEEAEYARLGPSSSSVQAESAYEEVEVISRECSPDAIKLGRVLHKGVFSEVFNGTVQSLPGFKSGTGVIVKLPREEAPVFEQSMVVNDIKALKSVGQHVNVIKLLAQCIHKDPVMAVFALEENGTLRTYLQKQRGKLSVHDGKQRVFIGMVQDVLNGMAYLDSLRLRILHRCVCADHVLVGKSGLCKVLGFGFSSDVLEREEYERSQGIEATLRWVAPEQISHHEHTYMSDIWSFGVLVWEMFNYGMEPYSDMTGDEAKQCILSGGMLGHPADATDDVYDIMQKCWGMNPKGRPKIGSLLKMLNRQNAG